MNTQSLNVGKRAQCPQTRVRPRPGTSLHPNAAGLRRFACLPARPRACPPARPLTLQPLGPRPRLQELQEGGSGIQQHRVGVHLRLRQVA